MAQPDLAGLLTGIGSAPIDPMQGASIRDREIALQQKALGGFRKGVGALTGGRVDARSTTEKAQEALAKLDPNKKEDREKILQIVLRVSPERVPALREEFSRRDKAEDATSASVSSSTQTRNSIAKQIEASHPDLARAIIDERASGQNQALQAGLDIIKERSKPSTATDKGKVVNLVNTQTDKTVGTAVEINGQLYLQNPNGTTSATPMSPAELENRGISASYVKPPAPLVSTVETPQQRALTANLERQGDLYERTKEGASANILKGQNARKILKKVNDGIATGAFPEFVANQSSAFQGFLKQFNIPVPAGLANNVLQQSELKKIQVDGMFPFIEEQGRGWTDADRENYFKTSAGFTQPWQYNEVVALTDLQNAVNGLDENRFAYARAQLDTVTKGLDETTLWNDYLKHLPRTKVITDFKRGDLTYDKLEVIEDGANLSQYWVESIPTGFVLEKPDGELIDMSWEDINSTALDRGQTAREFLAQQELKGSIKKAL